MSFGPPGRTDVHNTTHETMSGSERSRKEPIAEYKANPSPQVHWKIIQSIPGDIIIFIVATVIVGALLDSLIIGILAGLVAAIVPTVVGVFIAKRRWGSKEYRVYEDRVEEDIGLLATKKRNVPMDRIRSVEQEQSWFESFYDVGDVTLRSKRGRGMKLKYLDNPEDVYYEVSDLVDDRRRRQEDQMARKADAMERMADQG